MHASRRLLREAFPFNNYSTIIITLSKSLGLETAPKKKETQKKEQKANQQTWTAVLYYRRNFSLQHPGLVDPGGGSDAKGCARLSTLLSAFGQEGQREDLVAFEEESGIKPTAADGCPATVGLGGQEITSDPPFYDLQLSSSAWRRGRSGEGRGRSAGRRQAGSPLRVVSGRCGGVARGRGRKTTEFRKKVEKRRGGKKKPAGNDRSDKSWLDVPRNEAQNSRSAFRLQESFHCGAATSTTPPPPPPSVA